MSAPQYMPFYVGDYLRDTQHLSTEQHGVYLLLLMACWTMGALPDDRYKLAGIAKISQHNWKKFQNFFEEFFIKRDDGLWHQKRIDKERYKLQKLRDERSKAGSKGVAKREANRMQTRRKTDARARVPDPDPDPGLDKKDSVKEASASLPALGEPRAPSLEPSPKDAVEELWKRGIAILGRNRRSLLGKMVKQYGEFIVLRAITQTELKQPPAPIDYLLACCENMHRRSLTDEAERGMSPATKMLIGGRNAVDRLIAQDQTGRNTGDDCNTDVSLLDSRRNHRPA